MVYMLRSAALLNRLGLNTYRKNIWNEARRSSDLLSCKPKWPKKRQRSIEMAMMWYKVLQNSLNRLKRCKRQIRSKTNLLKQRDMVYVISCCISFLKKRIRSRNWSERLGIQYKTRLWRLCNVLPMTRTW